MYAKALPQHHGPATLHNCCKFWIAPLSSPCALISRRVQRKSAKSLAENGILYMPYQAAAWKVQVDIEDRVEVSKGKRQARAAHMPDFSATIERRDEIATAAEYENTPGGFAAKNCH